MENSYWQYFCGQEYFAHQWPCDPSQLSRWRGRLQESGAAELLAELLRCGLKLGQLKPAMLRRVTVDTTVQTKAIRFPTDARLYERSIRHLVQRAHRHGVRLRRSYARTVPRLMRQLSGYQAARQLGRAARVTRGLRTKLGRLIRELQRHQVAVPAVIERIHRQQRHDKNKVYSVHEPEVSCIAKGKARQRYEFGSKTALVSTTQGNWLLGAKVFAGNPDDGKTLHASVAAIPEVVRERVRRVLVDLGYRGHDEPALTVEVVQRRRRHLSRAHQRYWKRRNAIEPLIGHCKAGHRLERNHLKGLRGDQLNALLSIIGCNLGKLLRGLRAWLQFWWHHFSAQTVLRTRSTA
jgi:IS5 family transposase